MSGKPNILLLVIDSARYDAFSCYNPDVGPTTPNIDELADTGLLCENAFAAAGWTPPSHAAIFTGELPSETNSLGPGAVLEAETTLASELSGEGYETIGIATSAHITPENGYSEGFDDYVLPYQDYSRYSLDPVMALDTLKDRIWGRRSRTVYTTHVLKEKVAAAEEPFFLFANYATAHRPYRPPFYLRNRFGKSRGDLEKLKRLSGMPESEAEEMIATGEIEVTEKEWETFRSWFHAELHRMDRYVGKIIDFLKRKELFENTVIVITSDHGDEFGEHGLFMHNYLYDTALHVPLVMHGPGIPEERYDGLVSLADLMPTLVDLAGGDVDVGEGRALLPLQEHGREYVRAEKGGEEEAHENELLRRVRSPSVAVRTGDHKLIRRKGIGDELYDLGEDPGEQENIAETEPETVGELEQSLPEFVEVGDPQGEQGEDVERRLKELGYI